MVKVILILFFLCSSKSILFAQVIKTFTEQGDLSWTNTVNTNALYRVEWAANAGGPWYQTFQSLRSRDGYSNLAFTVDVPMFYRVVMTTNSPPSGMVWIDGGDSEVGQAGLVTPVHTNFVSGFWMDTTEVTKEKWEEVYNWAITNGYSFFNPGAGKTNNHPVHSVNWFDAVKWCNARSRMEGLESIYRLPDPEVGPGEGWLQYQTGQINVNNEWVNWSGAGYRLPTEAEWEKAARGGRQRRLFPWGGDTIRHAQANYFSTNSVAYDISPTSGYHPDADPIHRTLPVGSFPANPFGLYDMAGNVREWCWDWNASYAGNYQLDPRGPESGTERINRGGYWGNSGAAARTSVRGDNVPSFENNSMGFRCVRHP